MDAIKTSRFTGPWKFDELTSKVWDANQASICIPTLNTSFECRQANTRLIEAAPAMYELLQYQVEHLKNERHSICAGDRAFMVMAEAILNLIDREDR